MQSSSALRRGRAALAVVAALSTLAGAGAQAAPIVHLRAEPVPIPPGPAAGEIVLAAILLEIEDGRTLSLRRL
ncbi:MAG TPA: hypothetical protein VHT27_08445 [Solirubrobacteraceae bacterium]|nr:hypothetical protein [Solirubrobacteraceae bacterium]